LTLYKKLTEKSEETATKLPPITGSPSILDKIVKRDPAKE
jgi:hypothetical protein